MTAEFTASAGEINRANETCASQLTLTGDVTSLRGLFAGNRVNERYGIFATLGAAPDDAGYGFVHVKGLSLGL
jgi:hypothetical protein